MMIYRLENKDSEGPYVNHCPSPSLSAALSKSMKLDMSQHPTPHEEGLSRYDGIPTYVCGFSSRAQFEDWFPYPGHHDFNVAGFFVSVYEVPDEHVEHGVKQVMFDRRYAELTDTIYIGRN